MTRWFLLGYLKGKGNCIERSSCEKVDCGIDLHSAVYIILLTGADLWR